MRKLVRIHKQRGWALLETAIAVSLLGLMVVAVLTTVGKATSEAESRRSLSAAERAENALLGHARVHSRLPAPEEAIASPSRPGYVEGWLPAENLGMQGMSGRIRYIVEQSLTSAPAIYRADPLNLTAGAVKQRTTVNGLDLCAALMRRENAGVSLPGGMRMGFAVQQAVSTESGAPLGLKQLWLGDKASAPMPPEVRLSTRTKGFGEFAAGLGCFARFAQLSNSVRSTIAAADLLRLARQEVALRDLNLTLGKDSVMNLEWRFANWTAGIAKFTGSLALEVIGMFTTEAALIPGALNVASLTIAIGGTAWLLEVTGKGIEKGKSGNEKALQALNASKAYAQQMQNELDRSAALANARQDLGLNQ